MAIAPHAMRRLMSAALVVAAGLALALVLLWFLQRSLIYFPFGVVPPPAEVGLSGAEEVAIPTGDGETLRGWFVPAANPTGVTVVVFNGNAGHRGFRAALASGLLRQGLSVLLFDYRGFGGSTGHPSEAGLLTDARAVREYLEGRDDVDRGRIVYLGESLGAAVALGLAVERPPAALVLRSPFSSLADVGRLHYPFLPVGLFLRDRFDNLTRIAQLRAPVAVIAGDRDSIVPASHSRAVYDAAQEPKTWTLLPGADHNDPELVAGQAVIEATIGMLGR